MEVFMMANLICYGFDGVLLVFELKPWITHQPVCVCMRCNVYIHGRRFFNTELIKGPWTQEEDDRIIDLVNKYGLTKWSHCKVSYQNFLLLILGCFRTCSRTCSIYPL
ncbi:transcription factor MYB3R-1-like isoform X3 [Aegilops tauschii subsp. strangulata]|uniref:transcription factor MYB3R-1-like isoform X3 n=1 Tax=Aegilops tauschii subsp. strangulata TaxID=200361 RepID=UPI003CC85D33